MVVMILPRELWFMLALLAFLFVVIFSLSKCVSAWTRYKAGLKIGLGAKQISFKFWF